MLTKIAVSISLEIERLHQKIIACHKCSRLRKHCVKISLEKRRAFSKETYWAAGTEAAREAHAHPVSHIDAGASRILWGGSPGPAGAVGAKGDRGPCCLGFVRSCFTWPVARDEPGELLLADTT